MLVSREAFKVMDPVYQYKNFKEKKLFPPISGFGLFFELLLLYYHSGYRIFRKDG